MTNKIVIKKPSECSESELDTFEAMVIKSGEVGNLITLSNRIKSAQWLVSLFEEGKMLAGIAALKNPNNNYKISVFKKAESQENPNEFLFEAGWIYIEESFRGQRYSRPLLEEVLKLAGERHVYMTTRENNKRMQRTNFHYGFKQSGRPYKSENGDYNLVLFTRRFLE